VIVVGLTGAFQTWDVVAVIDLVHIGVDSGAPGCCPEFLLAGVKCVPEDVGISRIVDHEFHSDLGKRIASASNDSERRMVTSTFTRDNQLIGELGAFGCSSHFTTFNSVASSLEES